MATLSDKAEAASNHPTLRKVAKAGYGVDGALHLVIAALAVAVAFGSAGGKNADQSGALATIADQPAGVALLAVMALGLGVLALWHLSEVFFPSGEDDGVTDRVTAGAKAVIYGALAVTTATFALGSGSSGQSRKSSRGFTATLMDAPAGRWLVALVGVGVVVVGGYYVFKGVTKKFCDDLASNPGSTVTAIGVVGHVAKGVAFGVVGILFVVAAVQHQPKEAAGMDAALRTLKEQPFGQVLLCLVGVGLAAFGLYCFVRARHAKM